MKVKLKVIGGDAGASDIDLELPAVLGRGRDVSLNLSHPLVSRRHCELFEQQGRLAVRDLGSLNGTFVGSQAVDQAMMDPGDLLTVGTVTFRAVYEPEGILEAIPVADPAGDTVRPNNLCDTTKVPRQVNSEASEAG